MPKKLTYEEVKEFIENNSDCKLLSTEYKNNNTKMLFECRCEDKNKFEATFSKFKNRNKRQCNKCGNSNKGKIHSYKKVKKIINDTGNELVSPDYKNNHSKLLIKCRICGKPYNQTFNDFKNSKNKACIKCANEISARKQSFDYSKIKLFIENKGCKLISENYINTKTKLKILCSICKEEVYEVSFSNFKRRKKYHCNKCSKAFIHSKGEKTIESFLLNNNIKFKPQYRFDDCRNKKPLPFDFAILEENEIKFLIEFDGEGHYREFYLKENNKEKAKESFKQQQINDQIKTNYCKENNINIIRIPYYDFDNIEEILSKLIL